jgi:hypothetical protein
MKNTANVRGGKPIAVLLQSILGVSSINPLVVFYDIHRGKREVLFFILFQTPHETLVNTPLKIDLIFIKNMILNTRMAVNV